MNLLYFLSFLGCITLCLSAGLYKPPNNIESENEVYTGNICFLPLEVGVCRALFFRYGYDPAIKACKEFMYGGCQGNANNFKTLEECQEACEA
ncbi:hemolymph trypsin inhibitor A [Manduca sexta]|uniref:hemolymph trypsin inhibitor A n=1 Tax=Manduca sexta TaxID=7130 RepID=UPI00005AF025|nr:hemolymph trypsin inhibitor A [Manduca sexta]XP_037296103.1 hemolymph trypsin inhibitor A [Manduca sexta]